MKRLVIGLFIVALTAVVSAAPALAASNPSGTGQPNQSCEAVSASPNGFNTAGFAHAAEVYAGSSGSPTVSNNANDHAVSQYDVACYQVSNIP